jgi:cysteine synthase A
MAQIYDDNSLSIGNSPLVRLNRIAAGLPASILGKIEGRNPSYSVKCRIGGRFGMPMKRILKRGSWRHHHRADQRLRDRFGFRSRGVISVIDNAETMSLERRRLLKAFAELS